MRPEALPDEDSEGWTEASIGPRRRASQAVLPAYGWKEGGGSGLTQGEEVWPSRQALLG